MKHTWLVLYKITCYDKFGIHEDVDWRWEQFPNLNDAREFTKRLRQEHNRGGQPCGTSVDTSIVRTVECDDPW